jgi:hypothetical protein
LVKRKVNYIPPFSFSSIFHPHQFPAKNKEMASINFGSVVSPKPSFETLLPVNSLLKSKPDDSQDHWNQVPESSTKRSDIENFDTQQYANLAPQNTNDGFRLSVLVPCDDPDTGQTIKCLLVKKT